jgi:VanZ family protein
MSTAMFSSQRTYLIIDPVLRWFAPSISHTQVLVIHMIIRKLAHVTEYFITGILLFRAFRAGSGIRWAFSSVLIVVLLAASDEFHQSFVPTRTAAIQDVGIDILGGILAQCVSVLWFGRHRK